MLMAERQVTPAKGRNPRHHQSRSMSHNTSVFTNPTSTATTASPQSAQKQRKPNNAGNKRNQQQPAWDVPLSSVTGEFDSDGKFVESGADTNTETDEGVVHPGRQPRGGRRGGKQRLPSGTIVSAQQQQTTTEGRTASPRYGQQSSHQSASQPTATPAKTAYAGPAFHASPAPSTIPIPKFYSKSVPAAAASSGLQARLEAEETGREESPPLATITPTQSESTATQPPREVTPLDMLFNAHRAEKEKERSASGSTTPQGKLSHSNSRTEPAPVRVWADIYGGNQKHHQRHASGGALFNMEMDNEKPNNRNSGYSQAEQQHAGGHPHHLRNSPGPLAQDRAQLKSFLNSVQDPTQQPQRTPPYAPSAGPPQGFHSPSPFFQPSPQSRSGPTTPVHLATAQDPSLHYGNRNLSPLFHAAARGGIQAKHSGVRQELQYGAGPSPSRASHTPPVNAPRGPVHSARGTPPVSAASNNVPLAADRDPSVKTLEDSLKKMLNLSGN